MLVTSLFQIILVGCRIETVKETVSDISSGDNLSKGEKNVKQTDIAMVSENPIMFKHPTHLITPSEILSRAASSENSQTTQGLNVRGSKIQDVLVNNDIESVEMELKVVGETGTDQNNDFDLPRESHTAAEEKEKSFYSQTSDLGIQMARDCCVEADGGSITVVIDRPPSDEDEKQDMTKDMPAKSGEPETSVAAPQSLAPTTKGKKPERAKFTSCSPVAQSNAAALPQILALQDTLNQLMNMQKEMQKQMNSMISVPVSKEGKRLEASLGRSIEKVVRANTDAIWARFQEENTKHEKLERDRIQQLTNLITNCINKDLPTAMEKTLKKEISAIGPAIARAITPILEKSITSSITESFQKGVGEKAVNQLEKTVSSKLEVTVARQIQSQFQTSGKQALQDALRSALEASIIPAFELSCKDMFDQVDATFQKGLSKHINDTQQQFNSMHSPLAIALRNDTSSSVASFRSKSSSYG
ncbi:hypothetical protein OIU84_011884 [Salix udensis]|uniref:Enhancer of mRNA-decapping protein 4 n=1 Tax=Salix udensis TaxID=889485 RepID=A0AAD6NX61_9ROSI|nr:hypothetical protein OIU84_011884 [Salix udensis]